MMDKRFTPSYSYRAPRENAAGKPVGRALDFVFAAGWWFFFTELGHILITVFTKGCYCDFSLPEVPCSGVYMVMFEIAVTLALSVPPFMYFFRGMFVEKVGLGKKNLILLCSAGIALLISWLLPLLEEGFSSLLPDLAAVEFTPWADADIVRFVRTRD